MHTCGVSAVTAFFYISLQLNMHRNVHMMWSFDSEVWDRSARLGSPSSISLGMNAWNMLLNEERLLGELRHFSGYPTKTRVWCGCTLLLLSLGLLCFHLVRLSLFILHYPAAKAYIMSLLCVVQYWAGGKKEYRVENIACPGRAGCY